MTVTCHGEQIITGCVEMFLATGRVGLPCNMSYGSVTAEGVCLPISLLAEGTRWEVNMETVTPDTPVLGDDHVRTTTKIVGTTGILRDTEVPITEVLARFPSGNGVFTGRGEAKQIGPDTHITFKEGVEYVIR